MSKEKTPIEELIEYKDKLLKEYPQKSSYFHYEKIAAKMKELLPKEREAIIHAYNRGCVDEYEHTNTPGYKYYTDKYGE